MVAHSNWEAPAIMLLPVFMVNHRLLFRVWDEGQRHKDM